MSMATKINAAFLNTVYIQSSIVLLMLKTRIFMMNLIHKCKCFSVCSKDIICTLLQTIMVVPVIPLPPLFLLENFEPETCYLRM